MVPDAVYLAQEVQSSALLGIPVRAVWTVFDPPSTAPPEFYYEQRWFLPVPTSVLSQIVAFRTAYTASHGTAPVNVMISHKEHLALQQEIGAKGIVNMVEGLYIVVNHAGKSDLPQPVDMAPDLAFGADTPLLKYLVEKKIVEPKPTMDQMIEELNEVTLDVIHKPKKEDLTFGFSTLPGSASVNMKHPPKPETIKAVAKLMAGMEDMLYVNPKQLGIVTDIEGPKIGGSYTGTGEGIPMGGKATAILIQGGDPEQAPNPFAGKFTGFKPAPKVYHKSQSDEHGTPQALFDVLDAEFHFDLDVCAADPYEEPGAWKTFQNEDSAGGFYEPALLVPGNAKCPIYFTKETNGLEQEWFGTVWMNPPYTKGQVGKWLLKLIKEFTAGRITKAVALVAARPDTQWFQAAVSYACEVRFLKGRLTFEGSKDPAPFPSAILVFDATQKAQAIKFWDWKTGKAVGYMYETMQGLLVAANKKYLGKAAAGLFSKAPAVPKHPKALSGAAKFIGMDLLPYGPKTD